MDNKEVRSHQQRHWFSLRIATLFIIGSSLVLATALVFFPSAGVPKAHAATWTQIWSDEFNGAAGTGVDTSNWIYDTGQGIFGTGEIETMTNSTANVYQDGNGHLVITALRDANGNWTSGRLETQRSDFGAPAGGEFAMEASIQQPNLSGAAAAGYWPAFWSLGTPYRVDHNWPADGEIDMMEDVNGLSSVFGTLHCGVDPGGPCNETTGIGSGQRACAGCQTGFHTYRVEVDRSVSPEQIRWYLDGVNYFTVNANQVDPTTWANAVDHSFFILFDLAMGGGFPGAFGGGPTAATQSGGSMIIDDVRVYTANGNVTPTPTPTSTTGGSGFAQGVNSLSGNQGQFWFQPNGWTAGYVILHYTIAGQAQQNVNMSYNSGASQWQYTVGGLSPGQTTTYSFTYQQNGLQYDTGQYTFSYAAAQSLPGTWSQCAAENGTCSFTGTMTVAFGANGKFTYQTLTNGTACTDGVFGDPNNGTVKACYLESVPPATNVWSQCAAENGTCSFTGTMTVAFGANGKFTYQTLTNGTACTDGVFGDPNVGTVKACYLIAPPANTATWTSCAAENGTCSFAGTHEVAYGANGQFFYQSLTNGTACSNGVFGDTNNGTVKSCYYQ